jgi:hypothetical protein
MTQKLPEYKKRRAMTIRLDPRLLTWLVEYRQAHPDFNLTRLIEALLVEHFDVKLDDYTY